ncbi:SH3 domain-containing protein [Chryseobacterium sp. SNU WT5]|uniref:SH3 domain-containing protein n=1 Tax=Chryseobacterium sp. SNU WT5 TaxID=2594269 RepID=UPI00117F1305|nr:SH3 domain-containing protein [Chryseobacterium sp. SNU WT5]QDP85773.1 SH3 domain-containing protein [Chryseobacterium sp. SNU WT5]
MNKLFLIIITLFISCKNPSQEKIDSSKDLSVLMESFSNKKEKKFLENFPKDFSSFKNTFGWNDEKDSPEILYKDSSKYIDYWFLLIQKPAYTSYEKQIISILKNGHWEADAVNYFKNKSFDYIKTNKKYNLINSLKNAEAEYVLLFLFNPSHTKYDANFVSNLDKDKQEIIKALFSNTISSEKKRSSFSFYEENQDYFVRSFDVNKDGRTDKIVSSIAYHGEDLFVFYGNSSNEYNLALETRNFSEDGGNIIENIYPINNSKGLIIKTYFPDRGYYEKEYYIIPQDNTWILKNTIYKTMSDVSENAVKYICDVTQNIDITKAGWTNKINPIPKESERNKKCRIENVSRDSRKYFIQDPDGYTNLRKDKLATSEVLQKVKSGENIEVIDNSGDWFLVKTKEGKEGYIHKSRIKSK